ncbi:DUF512 domain-containing protein [Candidatus Dependentiae bacterium]|nr:DUF512 domain-containing protein [Candidatus Dependentiae bacterium]
MPAIISKITKSSPLKKYNIQSGDFLLSINGNNIDDFLDFSFYLNSDEKFINFEFKKNKENRYFSAKIKNIYSGNFGIELQDFKVMQCGNKCIFCFCDQHPETARKSLFFKDEDYRLSFLYGNYLTLSNLNEKHYKKIFLMRLSPLFISVHSTDDNIRRKILGVNYKFKILDKLKLFAAHRIEMHLQIVLIPGYNDNKLFTSLSDMSNLYPYVKSISVVPVGLTKHRKGLTKLKCVKKHDALKIIKTVEFVQNRCLKKFQSRIVFLSDEFYILAGKKIPDYEEYEEFHQLENGVGMLAKFEYEFKQNFLKYKTRIAENKNVKIFAVTGKITKSFFEKIAECLFFNTGISLNIISIQNNYLGKNVTVTGLISGKDIINQLDYMKSEKMIDETSCILIPDVSLRYNKDIFIDDVNIKILKKEYKIRVVQSNALGLLKSLSLKS